MAILTERNIVLVSKDSNGNTCLDYPLTKAEQVEDLESYVKNHSTQLKLPLSIANGGTGQTTIEGIRNTLGLGNTTGALPVANGGTGATSVAAAVKALLGTSAIGSSTKPIFYDGAALKACADSIGGGGIVAQLLGQNGYAKFANGLILQWGFTNSTAAYVTLPIAFATTNYVIVATENGDGGARGGVRLQAIPQSTSKFHTFVSASNSGAYYTGWQQRDPLKVGWIAIGV